MSSYALRARLDAATSHLEPPFAVLDLDAYRANAADLVRRAGGTPIRVASKSVRARWVLDDVLARPGFAGVMAFTLPEALWLAEAHDDVLVAYPTADRAALRALAEDERARERVTITVDGVPQLELAAPGTQVCLDVDASFKPLGGRLHLGVRRSPVHAPAQAAALARAAVDRGFRVAGVMAYEAQIAGVGDRPPGKRAFGLAVRGMQALSARELAARRAEVVAAVTEVTGPLRFVNGGGTGSLERTSAEAVVTEVAAGSGLYGPTLFDLYGHFRPRPAALFALSVVRRPAKGIATVLGGGYVASGAADPTRLPAPVLPEGLELDATEGAGEVQTPVLGAAADDLRVGDRVWFRHAKAGELCERFAALHLVEGDRVVDVIPTYRGEGRTFV